MAQAIFDVPSAVRVVDATQRVERTWSDNDLDRWFRRAAGPTYHALGFARDLITHDTYADVWLAQGTPTNETPSSTVSVSECYNQLRTTIWQGAPVLIGKFSVQSQLDSRQTSFWRILRAYSATTLRGTVNGTHNGPYDFVASPVQGLDGYFGPNNWASVHLLSGWYVQPGMDIIAEWNETEWRWECVGCCIVQ